MKVRPSFTYTGDNWAIRLISSGETIPFCNYPEMAMFFREFPSTDANPTPTRRATAPSHSYDLDSVADMGAIKVPAAAPVEAAPPPDAKTLREELGKIIIGQDTAVATIAHHVAMHVNKKNPQKPLSFVSYGPPGTGKTAMAKAIETILNRHSPGKYNTVITDLNTFTEAHTVYRLIGAPPGYAGYDDAAVFETVTENPYTIFVWDELDKAHDMVLKTFMGILDEGRLSARKALADGSREYDFRHTIHIFTSNHALNSVRKQKRLGFAAAAETAAPEQAAAAANSAEPDTAEFTQRIYNDTETARKAFIEAGVLPEIASRFSAFAEFKPLSDDAKIRILAKQIMDTGLEYGVELNHISSDILQALVNAATTGSALTVRSFKAVIEGNLAATFARIASTLGGRVARLEGTLEEPFFTTP